MRAVDEHGGGRAYERWIDVAFIERHVGAILAIEDQRKGVGIADAENDERSQALRIGFYAAHIDAIAHKLFADEAAHVVAADAGDKSGFQPEARGANRGVSRAAADIFGETAHVFEAPADLLAVEIDRRPANRDQIKRALSLRHKPTALHTARTISATSFATRIPFYMSLQHSFHAEFHNGFQLALRRFPDGLRARSSACAATKA